MDIDGHALRSRRPPGLGARRARGGRSVTIPVMGHVDSFLVQPNIPLSFHSDLILLCPMSSPGGATTRLSRRCGELSMRMIVQRWERSPETSVNILLFAGSRMSVFRLGLSRSEYG